MIFQIEWNFQKIKFQQFSWSTSCKMINSCSLTDKFQYCIFFIWEESCCQLASFLRELERAGGTSRWIAWVYVNAFYERNTFIIGKLSAIPLVWPSEMIGFLFLSSSHKYTLVYHSDDMTSCDTHVLIKEIIVLYFPI